MNKNIEEMNDVEKLVEFRKFIMCSDKEYFDNYLESYLRCYLDPVIDSLAEKNKID